MKQKARFSLLGRSILIHTVVFGWLGVILAILMPILVTCLPTLGYADIPLVPTWFVGCGICLVAALVILSRKRNPFREIGWLFLVIGLLSLGCAVFALEYK